MKFIIIYCCIGSLITIIREYQWFKACIKVSKIKGVNLIDEKEIVNAILVMPIGILLWPLVLRAMIKDNSK